MFGKENGQFVFHEGPIFNQLILADEINRTTPKSQSALLEAMEERQVTVDGDSRPLPEPFFVIATQNPSHQAGTLPCYYCCYEEASTNLPPQIGST